MVIFDIDGVLTDGSVIVGDDGTEYKRYRLTEIDAVNSIKGLGFKIGAITGEDTPIVKVFEKRIKWDIFIKNCKCFKIFRQFLIFTKLTKIKSVENRLNR